MDQGQKPVNPYAPAGAPYAPGSNTPPPSFAMPAVPNTGATFTPDETPEKPKFFTKKFIIAASVGLVLIIAAVATGLILQNNRKGASSSNAEQSYAADFYRFSQYAVNGKDEATKLSGDYAGLPTYSLVEAVANRDEKYLTKMATLFSQFKNVYEKARGISIEKLTSETDAADESEAEAQNIGYAPLDYNIANLSAKVSFLEQITSIDDAETTILDVYRSGGASAVENLFKSFYSDLITSLYAAGAAYAENQIKYGEALAKLLDVYNASGCLRDGYDKECAADTTANSENLQLYEEVENLQDSGDTFMSELPYEIISACYNITSVLSTEGDAV